MYPALGIDYGRSRIGLSLAAGPLVEPLPGVSRDRITRLLPRLVNQHRIRFLVIGLPEGRLLPEVNRFIAELKSLFPGPPPEIVAYDETLSSYDARRSLLHTSPGRRRLREHSAAASIILQSWLDSSSVDSVK